MASIHRLHETKNEARNDNFGNRPIQSDSEQRLLEELKGITYESGRDDSRDNAREKYRPASQFNGKLLALAVGAGSLVGIGILAGGMYMSGRFSGDKPGSAIVARSTDTVAKIDIPISTGMKAEITQKITEQTASKPAAQPEPVAATTVASAASPLVPAINTSAPPTPIEPSKMAAEVPATAPPAPSLASAPNVTQATTIAPAKTVTAIVVPPKTSEPAIAPVQPKELPPKDSSIDAARLIALSAKSIAVGDISAARSLLERAILSGDGSAFFALAETYDPQFLARLRLRGSVLADETKAKDLYRMAEQAGFSGATERLNALGAK